MHSRDQSLLDEATGFLEEIRGDGTLAQLVERYYGHVGRLNFVDSRDFRRHLNLRLPPLIPFFKKAAGQTGIDWRLLASIGYQESHWDSTAVSPTGVRGIMMLTRATARQMKVRQRTDPEQSILGGARYLKVIERKIPDRIREPDRMWLTLAGYNVGFGHLEDARILTQRQGGDPDKWQDVKKRLPLLSEKKWYKSTKHGYARGREPVQFVENIRSYYALLKRLIPDQPPSSQPPLPISSTLPAL
jgi:membrane-bound lytic murein transglycosylase F